jgi:hypothetical protein
MNTAHMSVIEVTHRRGDGSVVWREVIENRMFHQGVTMLLDFAYRGVDAFPFSWVGRLFGGAPEDSDTLEDLVGEPGGNGYSPVTWDRADYDWAEVELVGDELQTRGTEKTFGPASDVDWPVVTTVVLATSGDESASLWARYTLSEPRLVKVDETLSVRPIGVMRGAQF